MKPDRFIMFVADCFKHPQTGYLVSGLVLSGQLDRTDLGRNLCFLSENQAKTEVTLAGLVIELFHDMKRIEHRESSLHVHLSQDELEVERFKDGFLVDDRVGLQLVTFEGNLKLDTDQWEADVPYPVTIQFNATKHKGILQAGSAADGNEWVPWKIQFVSQKPGRVSVPELKVELNKHHFLMRQIKFKQNIGSISTTPITEFWKLESVEDKRMRG
jgi:hypothetical protein